MLALYEPLRREIEHERNAILRGERSMDRQNYGPYFLLLESEKLAVLTIHCVLSAILAPENKWTDGMAWRDQRWVSHQLRLWPKRLRLSYMLSVPASLSSVRKAIAECKILGH